jgi:hypothetical protein
MTVRIFGDIVSPCAISFDSLEGEGNVRYCGQCKLNVHNFTEMTADEVAQVVQNRSGRLCASIRKCADGSIYTDNCPYKLRRMRNAVRKYAPWAMLFVAYLFHQSAADAQGLVGAPIDGGMGRSVSIENAEPARDFAGMLLEATGLIAGLLTPFAATTKTARACVIRPMLLCFSLWKKLISLGKR